MKANRKIALELAMNDYLSDTVTPEQYEEMSLEELKEAVSIWQPFEYWSMEDVCTQIESLAGAIESALIKKDVFAINDAVIKAEMVNDLEENYSYTMLDAEEWVRDNGECVISDMWDSYSEYMQENAVYKG